MTGEAYERHLRIAFPSDRRGTVYLLASPWGLVKGGSNVINSPVSFTHVCCKGFPSHSVRGSLESHDMVPKQKPAWKCFPAVLEDEVGLRDFEVDSRDVNTVTYKA